MNFPTNFFLMSSLERFSVCVWFLFLTTMMKHFYPHLQVFQFVISWAFFTSDGKKKFLRVCSRIIYDITVCLCKGSRHHENYVFISWITTIYSKQKDEFSYHRALSLSLPVPHFECNGESAQIEKEKSRQEQWWWCWQKFLLRKIQFFLFHFCQSFSVITACII